MILLWFAWRRGDDGLGVVATPLLFPYVNAPSYLGLLAVVAARQPRWLIWGWMTSLGLSGWTWAATTNLSPLFLTIIGVVLFTMAVASAVLIGVAQWQLRFRPTATP